MFYNECKFNFENFQILYSHKFHKLTHFVRIINKVKAKNIKYKFVSSFELMNY